MANRRFNKGNRKRFNKEDEHRINYRIRIPEIRLVGNNLDEVSKVAKRNIESDVYPTNLVLEWASMLELDLVEISPKAKPPVCKIIDYKKFLYEKKKKEKELKSEASKSSCKGNSFWSQHG